MLLAQQPRAQKPNFGGSGIKQIEARRRQEGRLAAAEAATNECRVLRQYADWEIQTTKRIEKGNLLTHLDRLQARSDETLERRRRRLAAVLARESEAYEAELQGMNETQEQRRDRIANLALELRAEREELRQSFADEQKKRVFRAKCPEVLEVKSKATLLQVVADRSQQLEAAAKTKEREEEEERYFAALWEEERLKKEARARADKQRQQEIKHNLQHNLSTQREGLRRLEEERLAAKHQEDEEFREKLRVSAEEEAAAERRRKERQHELGKQNKAYNEELQLLKDEEKRKELEQDKEFLNGLLSKVKADEAREREAKRQAREAAIAHMRDVEKQMTNAAGAETELDRLWMMESNREWAKKEARWQADQDRRDKLLRDTYEGRAEQVLSNRDRRAQTHAEREAERERMIAEVERLQQQEKEEAKKRFERAKGYQECIKEQAKAKQEAEQAERQGRSLEMLAYKVAEEEYLTNVNKEISAIEESKPATLKHIPLQKSKRRVF